MQQNRPRLVLAALRGSAGKTTLAVALAAALRRRGHIVLPFKKGPDYIDAAWLALAAAHPCRNLDTYLMGREGVASLFADGFADGPEGGSISVVEGNRGIYDGVNPQGEHSTAELAKLLRAPVVLVVDCDKVTRTMAAMVLGCLHFDPAVEIRGVLLNRVGGARHAAVIRRTVEEACGIPVLGTVPRIADIPFAERHLGLIPPQESHSGDAVLKRAAAIAEEHLDIDSLVRIAENASNWEGPAPVRKHTARNRSAIGRTTIGVIRDEAFQFYYPENLEALVARGARVVEIDSLRDPGVPEVDALYIGGGFPEVHAHRLSVNRRFIKSLREAAQGGLPIYAECGGLIYLGESLASAGRTYPMAGILPLRFAMEKRPQGHGYTEVEVDRRNPFFPVGAKLKGHEFHYARIVSGEKDGESTVLRMRRGRGIDGDRDGYCKKNILAGFTHLHALGTPEWAKGLVRRATRYRMERAVQAALMQHRAVNSALRDRETWINT